MTNCCLLPLQAISLLCISSLHKCATLLICQMCGSLYKVAIGTFTLPQVKIETDAFFLSFRLRPVGVSFMGREVCNAPKCYPLIIMFPNPWSSQIHGHFQIHGYFQSMDIFRSIPSMFSSLVMESVYRV